MKNFLFLILVSCFQSATAQKSDSVYSAKTVFHITEGVFAADTFQFETSDTSLNDFQNFNPALQNRQASIFPGNIGTASHPLFFSLEKEIGYKTGRSVFDSYLFTSANLNYYRTKSPYTNLRYTSSGKKEQLLDVIHSQNIIPRWNAAVDFKRLVSEGDLQLQKSRHTNFYAATWYQSRNRRYSLLSNFIYNKLEMQENGGLQSDSVFLKPQEIPLEFQAVKLNSASNTYNTRSVSLIQYFDLGRIDTIKKDTLKFPVVRPAQRFSFSVTAAEHSFAYREEVSETAYYQTTFDSSATHDYTYTRQLQSRFSYSLLPQKSDGALRRVLVDLQAAHHVVEYKQQNTESLFNYFSGTGKIEFRLYPMFRLTGRTNYVLYGDFLNDFNSSAGARFLFSPSDFIAVESGMTETTPSLFHQSFFSNHFRWKNNFSKTTSESMVVRYVNEEWKLSVSTQLEQVGKLIYLDKDALPVQSGNTVSIYTTRLDKNVQWWRFGLDNTLIYQTVSNTNSIRSPVFFTYNSFYYEGLLFKKVLRLRAGIDLRYYTSYFPNDYMPATAQFYVQDQTRLGNYAVADFFATARLKRAKLMLKVEHLNQGIERQGYFQIPGYPIGKRALKLGVSWDFYD